MFIRVWFISICVALVAISGVVTGAETEKKWSPAGEPPASGSQSTKAPAKNKSNSSASVDTVIIHPYRSANVGAMTPGVIQIMNFKEGQRVEKDAVVCQLLADRYKLAVSRAEDRLSELGTALENAEETARIKTELLGLDLTTRQDELKARSAAKIAKDRVAEAKSELGIARLDLDSCSVKAPFNGYLAALYKQEYETVSPQERIFALIDVSKVYAVANVPESLLSQFELGAKVLFVLPDEQQFEGKVDKVSAMIDPKSRTKRVFALIDNSENKLEVGASGVLRTRK